jgi:DNA-binding transcriptional LysR family regulator
MNVKLEHVRAFLAAASTGSFTRAASMLSISQPALTVRIHQFETSIGTRVFNRNTRSVKLTSAGRELLPGFQRLMSQFDATVAGAKDLAEKGHGAIRVATLPSVGASQLPGLISKFKRRYPRITFVLRDAVNSRIRELVRNEEVDLGIAHRENLESDLEAIDLFEDRMHAVYLAKHPLDKAPSVTVKMLTKYPLILMDRQTSVRTLIEQALLAGGHSTAPACEATYMSSAIAMVRAELGVAILPSSAVEPGLYSEIRSKEIADPYLTRGICVIWRRDNSLLPAAESFRQMLSKHFAFGIPK